MITDLSEPAALACVGVFGIVQAVKEIERGRAERLIEKAKRDADGVTVRCLNDLSARIRSDSDSVTNRFERWIDRSLRNPYRRSR